MGVVFHNTFLVATLDMEKIGYIIGTLAHDEPRNAWILRTGVREDQRKNGVGSILIAELLDLFRTMGVRMVRLTISPRNVPALGL